MTSPVSAVPRIFVSHSHEDDQYCHDFVAELRTILDSADAVWYDEHNLNSGELLTEIQRQLHARPFFIVVLSKAALHRSTWVAEECRWAFQLRQRESSRVILPVTGEPIETADFYPDWMYLEGFRRIEAPGLRPFPAKEAARRAYTAITPSQVSTKPTHSQQSAPAPPVPPSAPPISSPPVLPIPADQFPAPLASLGFVPRTGRDSDTGKEVSFILPPSIRVSPGPFLYGEGNTARTVDLPAFAIARYPVTVAEYTCFVRAGHKEPPQGHLGVDWRTQLTWLDHPVICVSWHDATAYTEWLAHLSGQPWHLPTEEEWEKAARWDPRSGKSFVYPWGDSFDAARCNTRESKIGTTTPVGKYGKAGASPRGAEEMAGNVWEWTSSPYANSTDNRVLRGGSWDLDLMYARAACRHDNRPDDLYVSYGFRLVVAPVRAGS